MAYQQLVAVLDGVGGWYSWQQLQHNEGKHLGGRTLTCAASVAFDDANAVDTVGEDFVLVALLVLEVKVEDLVGVEAVVAELDMENELPVILSLDVDWSDVDLVEDVVKSCYDRYVGFGSEWKVGEHLKPLKQQVMELSLCCEVRLEVHVAAVVVVVACAVAEAVVAFDSWLLETDCTVELVVALVA